MVREMCCQMWLAFSLWNKWTVICATLKTYSLDLNCIMVSELQDYEAFPISVFYVGDTARGLFMEL